MAKWLHNLFNGNHDDEPLEDFVLYTDPNATPEPTAPAVEKPEPVTNPAPAFPTEPAPEINPVAPDYDESALYETTRLADVSAHLAAEDEAYEEDDRSFFQKNKKLLVGIGIPVIALFLVAALILTIPVFTNPLRGYASAPVSRGNIISSLNVSGTLAANAHYTITSTVSGTVIDSPVELGDRVEAGTVLYQLDDSDAQLALQRAENQLEKSKAVGDYTTAPQRIYAAESGVIQTLTIQNGQSVSAGQTIGTIKRADESVVAITSSVSGTVSSVNVRSGSSVSAGSLIASVKDTKAELDQKANQYDQKSDAIDVAAAENQLGRYTIVSPVSGVVTEKNAKVGDNVAMTDTKSPMMVITDTSSMRFTTQVEESKITDLKPGLDASITTDSVPNKTFNGKIKSVSPEGSRNKKGQLVFDVEIMVQNPGALKTGMNVSSKVILATAKNTLHIPKKALRSPDGKSALVLVKSKNKKATPSKSAQKKASKAGIEIPKGCRLATVQYGISDNANVQILSGLKRGEIVVYMPDWKAPDLKIAPADAQQNGMMPTFPGTSGSYSTPSGSSSSGSYSVPSSSGSSGSYSVPRSSDSSSSYSVPRSSGTSGTPRTNTTPSGTPSTPQRSGSTSGSGSSSSSSRSSSSSNVTPEEEAIIRQLIEQAEQAEKNN